MDDLAFDLDQDTKGISRMCRPLTRPSWCGLITAGSLQTSSRLLSPGESQRETNVRSYRRVNARAVMLTAEFQLLLSINKPGFGFDGRMIFCFLQHNRDACSQDLLGLGALNPKL